MHRTFNGLQLHWIAMLTTTKDSGVTRTTFRVVGEQISALEERLRVNVPALLILSDQTIEGVRVHYIADLHAKS